MRIWSIAFCLVWSNLCSTIAENAGTRSALSLWGPNNGVPKFESVKGLSTPYALLPHYGVPSGPEAEAFPSYYERATIVWINVARSDPRKFADWFLAPWADDNTTSSMFAAGSYPPQPPLAWHLDLNRAARAHCSDRAINCVDNPLLPHHSCNGTSMTTRFAKFRETARAELFWNTHPFSWVVGHKQHLGHEATMRFWPLFAVAGWLCDGELNPNTGRFSRCRPDHDGDTGRATALAPQAREVGCGNVFKSIVYEGKTEATYVPLAACNFAGTRHYTVAVVSGAHVWTKPGTESLRYVANFHVDGGVFRSAFAVVDGVPQPMQLHAGVPTSGAYSTAPTRHRSGADSCASYYFVFAFRDEFAERVERYPSRGSFWTFGDGFCTYDYTEHEVPLRNAPADFLAIVSAKSDDDAELLSLAKRAPPPPPIRCLNCFDILFKSLSRCSDYSSTQIDQNACPTAPCPCSKSLMRFERLRCAMWADPNPNCPLISCGICFPRNASNVEVPPGEWPSIRGTYGIERPTESCMPNGACHPNWNISLWTPPPGVRACDQSCGDQCGLVVFNDCGSRVCECPFMFPRDKLSALNSTAACIQGRCSATCVPDTCATLSAVGRCGSFDDGCGGILTCRDPCQANEVCVNRDKCVPTQCGLDSSLCGSNGTCVAGPMAEAVCVNGSFVVGNLSLGYFDNVGRTCTLNDATLKPRSLGAPCIPVAGRYTARWTGLLRTPLDSGGLVLVKFTMSNVNAKLFIGGLAVGNTTAGSVSGTFNMQPGWYYPIKLEIIHNSTESFAPSLVAWSYATVPSTPIPAAFLYSYPPVVNATCKTRDQTCASRKWPSCGPASDGCGTTYSCPNTCKPTETCNAQGKCVCTPGTCWDWMFRDLIAPTAQTCSSCSPAYSLGQYWVNLDNLKCRRYVDPGCPNAGFQLTCGLGFSSWDDIAGGLSADKPVTDLVQDCVGEGALITPPYGSVNMAIAYPAWPGRLTSTCKQSCGDRCGFVHFNGCGSRQCTCPADYTCVSGRCNFNSTALDASFPTSTSTGGNLMWLKPASNMTTFGHTISLWLYLNQGPDYVGQRDQYIVFNGATNTDGFGIVTRKPMPRKIAIQYGSASDSFYGTYEVPGRTWVFVSAVHVNTSIWKIYANGEFKCDVDTRGAKFNKPTGLFSGQPHFFSCSLSRRLERVCVCGVWGVRSVARAFVFSFFGGGGGHCGLGLILRCTLRKAETGVPCKGISTVHASCMCAPPHHGLMHACRITLPKGTFDGAMFICASGFDACVPYEA
eukprot:TRINITY_DN10511_c0_g1_i2.p1 TRINITY_DN10511_c0_g1~~TRINITY_DN10511_c0_g1_i2.p1  ORF type:complete len:1272 (-),score=275.20 TRINITY_DN10511_c0_g1_i2:40-3855(-)